MLLAPVSWHWIIFFLALQVCSYLSVFLVNITLPSCYFAEILNTNRMLATVFTFTSGLFSASGEKYSEVHWGWLLQAICKMFTLPFHSVGLSLWTSFLAKFYISIIFFASVKSHITVTVWCVSRWITKKKFCYSPSSFFVPVCQLVPEYPAKDSKEAQRPWNHQVEKDLAVKRKWNREQLHGNSYQQHVSGYDAMMLKFWDSFLQQYNLDTLNIWRISAIQIYTFVKTHSMALQSWVRFLLLCLVP